MPERVVFGELTNYPGAGRAVFRGPDRLEVERLAGPWAPSRLCQLDRGRLAGRRSLAPPALPFQHG